MRKFKKLKEDYLRGMKQNLADSRTIMELEDKVKQREKAFLEADKNLKEMRNKKKAYLEELNNTLYRNTYGNPSQVLDKIRELTRAYED